MPKTFLRFVCVFLAVAALASGAPASSARAGEVVPFAGYQGGTIVIKTKERRLYFALGDGRAIRYPVGVGKAGQQWAGVAYVDGKYVRPDWVAPPSLRRSSDAGLRHPRRLAAKSDGRGGTYPDRRRVRHSRHQPAAIDRRICFRWLYPDAQCGRGRSLRAGRCRHASGGDPVGIRNPRRCRGFPSRRSGPDRAHRAR